VRVQDMSGADVVTAGRPRSSVDVLEHDGLRFDVVDRGPRRGPVVLLLHGFPGGNDTWVELASYLGSAGYRTVALEQRGYSSGARPAGVDAYHLDHLAGDAVALVDALAGRPVHVIGHDWGALVGWHLAGHHPERVASLVALSTPHPAALAAAVPRSSQGLRSLYVVWFQLPVLAERMLLARRGALLRAGLGMSGLSAEWADRYTAAMLEPGRLTAALNWYRAAARAALQRRSTTPAIGVPTTFAWGSEDVSVATMAARLTANHVTAPYRSHAIDGSTHWLPELHAATVWPCIAEHLERHASSDSDG
jgi:pimeloyl-ACP methyl ester carboxylesterase